MYIGGYAIGYDIFEGNIYEGHTLIPFLEKITAKFNLNKPIVVADAGLLPVPADVSSVGNNSTNN